MRRLTTLLAALILGSAAGVVGTVTTATAAACAPGTGVTVVVEGQVRCDSNGGGDAASNFTGAGHSLTYVSSQPGMVCRVDGAPASAGCVNAPPANKYWGLFWSDGKTGAWKYSSLGVGALNVPQGGWVAFVFQNSNTKRYPAVTPKTAVAAAQPTSPAAKPKPKPNPRLSDKPASSPEAGVATAPRASSSTPATTATPSPTPSASPTAKTPTPRSSSSAVADESSATPSGAPVQDAELAEASNDSQTEGSGGLGLVAAGIGALLIAGMGATLWRRRAAGGPS